MPIDDEDYQEWDDGFWDYDYDGKDDVRCDADDVDEDRTIAVMLKMTSMMMIVTGKLRNLRKQQYVRETMSV